MVDSSCARSSVRAAGSLSLHGTASPPYPWSEYPVLASSNHLPCWKTAIRKVWNSGKAQECGLRSGLTHALGAYILACSLYLTLFLRPIPCYWSFSAPKYLVVPSPFLRSPSPCHYAQPDQLLHHLSTCADVLLQAHLGLPVIFPSQRPLHQEEFLCDWGKLFNLSKLQTVPLWEENEGMTRICLEKGCGLAFTK